MHWVLALLILVFVAAVLALVVWRITHAPIPTAVCVVCGEDNWVGRPFPALEGNPSVCYFCMARSMGVPEDKCIPKEGLCDT